MDYETLRRRQPLASQGPVASRPEGLGGGELDEQDSYGNAWMQGQLAEGEEASPEAEQAAEEAGVGTDGPVYDLAALTTEAREALASGTDAERRVAQLLDEAEGSYGSLLSTEDGRTPGRIVVTTSDGNGGQPVLVIVPPGFSADQDTAVHTHYHGDHTTVGAEHSAEGRTQAILDAVQADPQTILVLPEDQAVEWNDDGEARFSATWSNVRDQPATTADALRAVGQDPDEIDHRVLSAHSGGGAAIRNLARRQREDGGTRLEADELLLHDCFYGGQGASVLDWLKELPEGDRPHVSYFRAGNAASQTEDYEEDLGDSYDSTRVRGSGSHNRSLTEHFGQPLRPPD